MQITPLFYTKLFNTLNERQQLLEYNFQALGPSFNVASVADVKQLRRRILEGEWWHYRRDWRCTKALYTKHSADSATFNASCIEESHNQGLKSKIEIKIQQLKMKMLPDSLKEAVDEHPLIGLISEYRRNNHLLASLGSVLCNSSHYQSSYSFGYTLTRTFPWYSQLGTVSGRALTFNPGLQTMAITSKIVPLVDKPLSGKADTNVKSDNVAASDNYGERCVLRGPHPLEVQLLDPSV